MKNVTIALNDSLVTQARRIAAERGTTLNAMIRRFLTDVVERDSRLTEARSRIVSMCRTSDAEVGNRSWSRDQLHER